MKVELRNGKGLNVEARRGYYAPNRELNPAEHAKEEISAAFFSTEEINDLPASMETQFLKTGDYEAVVNVVARVDVKQLRYRQEDGRNHNDVTIVCGLFDDNGNYVTGMQKVIEMSEASAAKPKNAKIAVPYVSSEPGTATVHLAMELDLPALKFAVRDGRQHADLDVVA